MLGIWDVKFPIAERHWSEIGPLSSRGFGQERHYTTYLQVFVSHASEDKPRVRELVRRLREDGFDPWLDEERLLPGHDWQHEIVTAVSGSEAVIVCLSKTSVSKSGYVQKELRRVLEVADYQPEGAIFVIPVRLDECLVPVRLRQWHHTDLFTENGYQRLRDALNTRERGGQEAAHARSVTADPVVLPKVRRRSWLFALVCGMFVTFVFLALSLVATGTYRGAKQERLRKTVGTGAIVPYILTLGEATPSSDRRRSSYRTQRPFQVSRSI